MSVFTKIGALLTVVGTLFFGGASSLSSPAGYSGDIAQPFQISNGGIASHAATTTRFFGTVSPQVNNLFDLGEPTFSWRNLYASGTSNFQNEAVSGLTWTNATGTNTTTTNLFVGTGFRTNTGLNFASGVAIDTSAYQIVRSNDTPNALELVTSASTNPIQMRTGGGPAGLNTQFGGSLTNGQGVNGLATDYIISGLTGTDQGMDQRSAGGITQLVNYHNAFHTGYNWDFHTAGNTLMSLNDLGFNLGVTFLPFTTNAIDVGSVSKSLRNIVASGTITGVNASLTNVTSTNWLGFATATGTTLRVNSLTVGSCTGCGAGGGGAGSSSTLLGDSNTFSGQNTFTATTTFIGPVISNITQGANARGTLNIVQVVYDVALDGGAVGMPTPIDITNGATIPNKTVIWWIGTDVITPFTSLTQTSNFTLTLTTDGGFSSDSIDLGSAQGGAGPIGSVAGTATKTTGARTFQVNVSAEDLLTGKAIYTFAYYQSI